MCGRFGLFARLDAIEDRYDRDAVVDYEPQYNIAPEGNPIPTVPNDADAIKGMHWGIRPQWVEDPEDWSHPINARAETLGTKPSFREAFEKRRCLIPANGFYEWTGRAGSKIPHWVSFDEEIVSFAGLWERWIHNGTKYDSCVIITTQPNAVVEKLHDRMPVVLELDEEERWLQADDADRRQSLLDPYPSELTESYEVSTSVNNPANDGPELIEPVGSDQSGLGQFS